MRFTVPSGGLIDTGPDPRQTCLSGFDGRVFPSRVALEGNTLELRRTSSESGSLNISYPVTGFGRPVLTTASLREQEGPYLLPLELARGKICQVRNQLATWESLGMSVPDEFRAAHREAHRLFGLAATSQDDVQQSIAYAHEAIAQACLAAGLLSRTYVQQRLKVRFRRTPQLPVAFGCAANCPSTVARYGEEFCETFNSAAIPVEWTRIEVTEGEYDWSLPDALVDWCVDRKLLMRAGPLLELSATGLPSWLSQWAHDFFNLQSFLCDFVETAVSRYAGRIRMWEISSRVNTGGAFGLNEEERLTLVARTLEVARQVDEEAQLFIRIEEPWGSYQSAGEHRLSPIQFVDSLLRCGIGLSGINLEIAVGYSGRGSGSRDVLDLSRMLDQWSALELPLHVTLAVPGAGGPDPQAAPGISVSPGVWNSAWSSAAQADWISTCLPLLMAKQSVVGIYWSHLTDAAPHVFPNAGLVDASGELRPGLEEFRRQRTGEAFLSEGGGT